MPSHEETWSVEKLDILTKALAEGKSNDQIAALLGPGYTRNGVAGKIHRLGLERPNKRPSYTPRAKPSAPVALKPELPDRAPKPEPAPKRFVVSTDQTKAIAASRPDHPGEHSPHSVSVLKVRDGLCRWPLWGDQDRPKAGTHQFCGCPISITERYCDEHRKRAFAPFPARRSA